MPQQTVSHMLLKERTRKTRKKGETHQKVELIFQKVSGGLVIEPLVPYVVIIPLQVVTKQSMIKSKYE